jgi:glycolate oxidase
VLFDAKQPGMQERALEASHEILRMCIRFGGTISGEHGVGLEKKAMMGELFDPADLEVMNRIRSAWNPDGLLNPCKILPGGSGCREAAHATGPAQMGGMQLTGDAEGPWI